MLRGIRDAAIDAAEGHASPRDSGADTIPKIIHQTFPGRSLPREIRESFENIRGLNPTWDWRLYDDDDIIDFIKSNYAPTFLRYYERINPLYGAARADLFRYLMMYKCGGVYLDAKSTLTKPLDASLRPDDRYLLSHWRNGKGQEFQGTGLHRELRNIPGGEFQQWHIVAAPGHPFLAAVIEKVLRNIDRYNPGLHDVGRRGVLRLTGPIAYTRSISPIAHRHAHRFVDSQIELGFRYSVFERETHHAIFPHHYTHQTSPIVGVGIPGTIAAAAFRAMRQTYRFVRRQISRAPERRTTVSLRYDRHGTRPPWHRCGPLPLRSTTSDPTPARSRVCRSGGK